MMIFNCSLLSYTYDASLLKTRDFRAVLETRHPGDSAAFVPGGSIGLLMYLAASHVVLR